MSDEKKDQSKTVVPKESLEDDPVLGYGDWEVESEEDNDADHIDPNDVTNIKPNEFDGFDVYDSE